MARKIQVTLMDDLDGSEAVETVTFSFRGVTYEIDLSDKNTKALDRFLGDYISHARKVAPPKNGRKKGRPRQPQQRVHVRASNESVRAWAKSNHIQLSSRGRIPYEVWEAFEKANPDAV